MIPKAMKITKLKSELEAEELESIAVCVKTEIISGKNDKLVASKDNITRSEVTVIVRKLQKKSNLI